MALFVAINAKYVHTSLSVRYLKKAAGDDCELFECSINDSVYSISESIFKTGHKHILFSCYLWNIEIVLKIAELLKKADNSILITLGGPEVSFDAEKLILKTAFIDHIICGEGETKIFDFIKNPPKRGVYYFGFVENLDELPFPYEKEELYLLKDRLVYYETSRGCPYNCAFCLSSVASGVRYKSLELVENEIMQFINAGVRLVKLVDRTFNSDFRRAKRIIEFIKKNSVNTSFHFEIKAEVMNDELIDSLLSAPKGLFQLEIGVQSTNPDTLLKINRRESFEVLSQKVKLLKQNDNMHLHLDLIAGLPDESLDMFIKSFNDVYSLYPHDLQLGFLKKLKGAKITDADGCFSSFPPYEIIKTDAISYDEIVMLKGVYAVLEKTYNQGVFKNTLLALEKEYSAPFDMYRDLSVFYDFTKSVSQKKIYEILLDFSYHKFGDGRLKDALIYDFCLNNRDFLTFMENDNETKTRAFEFVKNDALILKYFPDYFELKPTERYKKIRFYKIGESIFGFDTQKNRAENLTEVF